jgi:hypothetical protein
MSKYSHHVIYYLIPSYINSAVKTVSLNKGVNVIYLIIYTLYTLLAKRDTILALKLTSIMKPDVVVFTGNCIVYYPEGHLTRPL